MELQEAKDKFVQAWGTLGSNWGINRTMAQVHALLLASEEGKSTEDIMQDLNISRGNANMNIRQLIDWGLIQREFKPGERKEFFSAEKDVWKISRLIARERHKRELEPALKLLEELVAMKPSTAEAKKFHAQIKEIDKFARMVDTVLLKLINGGADWFGKFVSYLIK
jgi:DNA-binding transcriptional regulator GbsR (MarR family)